MFSQVSASGPGGEVSAPGPRGVSASGPNGVSTTPPGRHPRAYSPRKRSCLLNLATYCENQCAFLSVFLQV